MHIYYLLKAAISHRYPYVLATTIYIQKQDRERTHEHGDKKAQRRTAGRHGLAQPILLAAPPHSNP